jgi:putative ABC transport system substrate-binding protein
VNRRRLLCAAAAWPALAWAGAVLAQSKQPILIGWLETGSRASNAHYLAALKAGLAALGWKEGSQIVFEERWADGRIDRLPALAAELAAKKPAIIVAAPVAAVAAAAKAAPKTPIVQASGADLVVAGLAASLAQPGGMVTGVASIAVDVSEKYLELLLAAAPKLQRVGFLADPNIPNQAKVMEAARRSAARHSIEARFAEVARPEELEPAISRLAKEGAQGLVVLPSGWFLPERQRIVELALAQRWPMIAFQLDFAQEGALLSYSVDRVALFRRAAYYVDKILKGAKPGDLPIEQPMKVELVINRRTAKALGITIPQELLLRADRVIE